MLIILIMIRILSQKNAVQDSVPDYTAQGLFELMRIKKKRTKKNHLESLERPDTMASISEFV